MKERLCNTLLIAALVISSLAPYVTYLSWGPSKVHPQSGIDTFATKYEVTAFTRNDRGGDPTTRELLRGARTSNVEAGMAGCLLIKDENHRLTEWIAYHYHTLPLRYLVVAVDDTSVSSPSPILDLWRKTTGMDIVEWSDRDFGKRAMTPNPISRQMEFIPACAAYHKKMNRTWVALTDVDEYIVFNSFAKDDLDRKGLKASQRKQFIVDSEEDLKDPNFATLREQRLKARERLPGVGNGTVLDYMRENEDSALWLNDTCLTIPRLAFSAVESTREELSLARADQFGFNVTNFGTLRFFHHARKGSHEFNKWGKVILDVSRIPMDVLTEKIIENPHKPFKVCKRPQVPYETAFLRCNHYTGSWEAYSFKGDYRKTREEFNKVGNISFGATYDIQPWLSSFIRAVGREKAHFLLHGAGDFKMHRLPSQSDRV